MNSPRRRIRLAVIAMGACALTVPLGLQPEFASSALAATTQKIVASGTIDGTSGLVLMNPDGSDQTLIPGTRGDIDPALSPDGTTVAFTVLGDTGINSLETIGTDGTGQKLVRSAASNAVWSPDGTKLAFESHPVMDDPTSDLVNVSNPDGSDDTTLGTGDNPSWSSDGAKLAFTYSADSDFCDYGSSNVGGDITSHIGEVNADGTNRVELTGIDAGQQWIYYGVAWFGARLALTREHQTVTTDPGSTVRRCFADAGDNLSLVSVAGGTPSDIVTFPSANVFDYTGPSWSADGTVIAFQGTTASTVKADGTGLTTLPGTIRDPSFGGVAPSSSPVVCTTFPSVSSMTFTGAAGTALSESLPKPTVPAGRTIASWNLVSQTFGSASWNFKWGGDGTFSITPAGAGPVSFSYSVTDSANCTSNLATETYTTCTASTNPVAQPASFKTKIENLVNAALPAPRTTAGVATWNLVTQSFGTKSWQFHWRGTGSFNLIPPRNANVRFTYSVTDRNGCVSAPVLVKLGPDVATFSSASSSALQPVYVGMGDSYSSGEGNPITINGHSTFLPGTSSDLINRNDKTDDCHRSPHAYPYQQYYQNLLPKIPDLHFVFTACSGAIIENLTTVGQYPNGLTIDRQPQITQVEKFETNPKQYVRYISLTAGGNNARFSDILTKCIELHLGGTVVHAAQKCVAYANSIDTPAALQQIQIQEQMLYEQLLDNAPYADIFVMDYPQLFNTNAHFSACVIPPGASVGLDQMEYRLNSAIKAAVANVQASYRGGNRIHFVELDASNSAFNDHNLCRGVTNNNRQWINGLETTDKNSPVALYTAHPNVRGHHWIESQLDTWMKAFE